jgi:antitoxin MazE
MKLDIVRIGNSKGIRLPKALMEQCGFDRSVDVVVRDGTLHVKAARRARQGWDERFRAMAERGDDVLVDGESPPTEFDRSDWTW